MAEGRVRRRGSSLFLAKALAIPTHADPHVYFSNHDDVQGALREAIDGCHNSLEAALFEMTSPVLARRASARGRTRRYSPAHYGQ